MADITQLQDLELSQSSTAANPVVTVARKISDSSADLITSSALVDKDGSTITKACILAIRKANGYTENVYVAAGGITGTAVTITTRGLPTGGIDLLTSIPANAVSHEQGEEVFLNVSPFILQQITDSLQGDIEASLKFETRPTYGTGGAAALPSFADATARDAALTSPQDADKCFLEDGTGEQHYDGGWLTLGVATPVTASLGVQKAGNDLQLDLAANPGLEIVSNKVRVLADFGAGSDGDVTISSNTSLSRDMYYNNLTVDATFTLDTNGYRVFVKEAFANNGDIDNSGTGGSGITGGIGGGSANGTLAKGKDGLAGKTGQAGGAGGTTNAAGQHGTAGTPGSNSIASSAVINGLGNTVSGLHGLAGTGGSAVGPGGSVGGAQLYGTLASSTALQMKVEIISQAVQMISTQEELVQVISPSAGNTGSPSGGGGGGGGGDGSGSGGDGGEGGDSGAGGANGGIVAIYAKNFDNQGTITCTGGDGVNGVNGVSGSVPVSSGAGGGGGGGGGSAGNGGNGGTIVLCYQTLTNIGTTDITGGAGGTKGAGGAGGVSSGNDGNDGSDGSDGLTGDTGSVIQIQV